MQTEKAKQKDVLLEVEFTSEQIAYLKGYAACREELVKRGRWLKNGDRYCECSVCHHEGNISGQDNYCWYCGARMDEVEE